MVFASCSFGGNLEPVKITGFPKLLKKMKEAGCEWIALGVESGNEHILRDLVKKGETKDQIRSAVKMIKDSLNEWVI